MTVKAQRKGKETPARSFKAIRRVLIVDDSRLQRRILSASLSRFGFEVLEAISGQEGLEICKAAQPDLVLSDWMMPGMDGIAFCRAFRALARDGYGYFILLTSKSQKEEVARGFEAGADDFLTKPVSTPELMARISAGERILRMQQELSRKNILISETLDELQVLYDSLDRDLAGAKKLQQSLAPDRYVRFQRACVAQMLRSSGHVGGDLVGHFSIDADNLGLFSIDVSGHGVSSALMTARLAGFLSSASPEQNVALGRRADGTLMPRPPDEVVAHLNEMILEEMETEHYFTMVYAHANVKTGAVSMAQAGHPHPLVQRRDGRFEVIGNGGLPVGLFPGVAYERVEFSLARGERLLVFTDGINECPNAAGELLGDDGLIAMLGEMSGLRGDALFETLLWKLGDFADGKSFPDDISGIVLEMDA